MGRKGAPKPQQIVPLFQYDHDAEPADHPQAWGRYPFIEFEKSEEALRAIFKEDTDEHVLIVICGLFFTAMAVTCLRMLWVGL